MSYATPAHGRKAQNHKALFNFVAILALLASLLLQIAGPSTPAASAHAVDASAADSAYARDLQPPSGQPAAGFGVEAFTGGIVQEFYVPMPEAQIRQAFLKLASNTGTEFESVISVVVPVAGTVVVLDHWEDGYEVDLNNPAQSTTRVWGDGVDANGIAPGFTNDPNGLPAGQVLATRNLVQLPRSGAILFDGRDRLGATQAVVMTRSAWATTPGSVLADATEVPSTADYGTSFIMPIGEDVIFPTPLTASMFELTTMFVQAAENGTQVQIDTDGNGTTDTTITLNRGESYLVNGGIRKGATVNTSKPVQVQLLTGDIGANYESRWFTIPPRNVWTSEYYAPVGTATDGDETYVFLHNPNAAPITVNYTTRVGSGSFQIPAKDTYRFLMPQNSGAQFVSPGGEPFFAVGTVGARPTQNNVHDWGFSLVPAPNLTTELVVGWGPGTADLSANGNPAWVTAARPTTIYVDYNGDRAGAITDPNGGKYDAAYTVSALEVIRIYEPDKDQTGLRIYTIDGTLITGAWGQDPATAGPGNPFLDVGTAIPSFPIPVLRKSVTLHTDNAPAGLSVGDVMEYTITLQNKGLVALSAVTLSDDLPAGMTYVLNSTTRDGITVPDTVVPPGLTPFPVDESGITVPILLRGADTQVKYRIIIAQTGPLTNAASTNLPGVETGLTLNVPSATPTPCTIKFTDAAGAETDYQPGGSIYVTCTDPDANTDPATLQSFSVVVRNLANGDLETLLLTETGVNTGVFRNTAALPSSTTAGGLVEDGTLLAVAGHTISVSYTDPVNGETCSDTAVFATASKTKPLYLSDPNQALDRVDPVATSDTTTAQTAAQVMTTAAIVVDAVSTGSATEGSSGTAISAVNVNHTTGVGANRLMLVGISFEDDNTANFSITSVRWVVGSNTQNLTQVIARSSATEARSQIWSLTAPASGAGQLQVVVSSGTADGDAIVVGVTTFTGVNQTTPLGTATGAIGTTSPATVNVSSATGELVFDTVGVDDSRTVTVGGGQTSRWNLAVGGPTDGIRGAASTEAGAGTVTMSWTLGTNDSWATCAVPIKPAFLPVVTSFTQTPALCKPLSLPTGGSITADVYFSIVSGTMPANPNITAAVKYGATTIATSSGVSSDGSKLTFAFPALSSTVDVPTGQAIMLEITTNQSNVSFRIDYDSQTKPSKITLPTTTVISVDSFAVYDAPYPGGAVVTTPVNGQILYVRTTVSDPFGASDITSLPLSINGPGTSDDIATTLTDTSVVASTSCSKTYEYTWRTGVTTGAYTLAVTAKEGYENAVTDQKSTTVTLSQLDLGTPSTTEFTTGNNGPGTDTYAGGVQVCVRVTDIDQNTDPLVVETVTAIITSSSGDSETVTLTETGPNTGVFTACIPASTTGGAGNNSGTLNAPLGSALTVTYVDPTDPTDTSSDAATVPNNTAAVSVVKTLVSPADGQIVVGEQAQFRLRVTNTGNTTLTTVQVVDTFPSASLNYASASPTPNNTSPAGTLTWNNVGPLTSGQSKDILVNFTGLASANPAVNTANVTTGGGPTASDTENVVVTRPGVSVAKTRLTPASGAVNLGDDQTYRIVVQNTGVTAIATLPLEDSFSAACFRFVSATITPDSEFAGGILWNDITGAGSLAVGNSITIDVTLKAMGGCNPANNTAAVTYAVDQYGDPVPPAESSADVQTLAASISGSVFADGGNLVFGADDTGLTGVVVRLYTDPNGDGDPSDGVLKDITTTNPAGYYEFLNLGPGNYVVVQEDLPGYFSLDDVQGADRDNRVAVTITALTVYPNNNFLDTNQRLDLGDHPDSYGTRITAAAIGAAHVLHPDIGNDGKPETLNGAPAVWLGATVDTETDGQPTTSATGDDNAGIDDEDGIVARPSWTTGGKLQFQVQVSSSAAASGLYLGVWIDWNKSSAFETAAFGSGGEMYRVAVNTGTNTLQLDAPSGFSGDPALEFRLRLYAGDPGTPLPTGPTPNGEVEDYVYSLSPLAVTMANFEAMQVDNYVLLTWETNSELNNRGFNLWRGTSPAGPDTRLNDTLIPSQSQGNPGGFTYTWEDRVDLVLGTTYYYWVDDVDLSGGTTRHGPVSVTYGDPLAVILAGFAATPIDDAVLVTWETVSEVNNTGFNLYRSRSADGADRSLLAFVPAQSPGSTAGASYSVTDAAVTPGQTTWYLLEDVDLNGATTLHGPVSATVSAPTAVTLASLQATPAAPAIPAATAALAGLAGLMAAAGVAVSRRRAR